ncbi:MAG TPA: hypothetical protein VNG51_12265 [Ktedonobacteraceae bacterium]|nr:hypothetical protein [Ktedonobacteraceae bacterium]
MPKTRKRKKGTVQKSTIGTVKSASDQNSIQQPTGTGTTSLRRPLPPPASGLQGLVWPAMVSLGCWGMAASFFFFSNDPNRIVFGALVVMMALLWTFSFSVRLRKMMALRQK